jgi:hypothetical protein
VKYQQGRGYGQADDYVFVPEYGDYKRKYVPDLLAKQFKQVLIRAGMDVGKDEARRVMHSIRHSSIMDRLVHGDTVDINAIDQNARTSTKMIDRFLRQSIRRRDEHRQNSERHSQKAGKEKGPS